MILNEEGMKCIYSFLLFYICILECQSSVVNCIHLHIIGIVYVGYILYGFMNVYMDLKCL
jgi:hypothetical protein